MLIRDIRLGMRGMRSLMRRVSASAGVSLLQGIPLSQEPHFRSGNMVLTFKNFHCGTSEERTKMMAYKLVLLLQSIGNSYTRTFLREGCTESHTYIRAISVTCYSLWTSESNCTSFKVPAMITSIYLHTWLFPAQ